VSLKNVSFLMLEKAVNLSAHGIMGNISAAYHQETLVSSYAGRNYKSKWVGGDLRC